MVLTTYVIVAKKRVTNKVFDEEDDDHRNRKKFRIFFPFENKKRIRFQISYLKLSNPTWKAPNAFL